MSHTPGPWHIGVRQPSSYKFIYGPSGEEVADCDRTTNFPSENLGNARLIAAAPHMLDTLEGVLRILKHSYVPDLNNAIALIESSVAKSKQP